MSSKDEEERDFSGQDEIINKKQATLPKKIIPIPNRDKEFHESWKKNSDELDFPHPFRAVITAPPNTGKSTIIMNLIMRQKPVFKKFIIIHCSPDETKEYDILGARKSEEHPKSNVEIRGDIPDPKSFNGKIKTLVVLDDIEYKNLNKTQLSYLDRLFGFVSTHMNVSIIATAQVFFNLPPAIKRMANVLIIGKLNDRTAMNAIASKVGMNINLFQAYMKLLTDVHDTLWIDLTEKTPYPIRKNGYEIYEVEEREK